MAKLIEPALERSLGLTSGNGFYAWTKTVMGEGDASSHYAHAINNLLGLKQEPNLVNTFYVEHVNLISSPQGKAIRKKSRWRHEEEISEQANASL